MNDITIEQALINEASLTDRIRTQVKEYLTQHQRGDMDKVYRDLMAEIEKPLFETVMRHTRNNQSEAARVLGLSRGTLRKKLKQYFGSCYVATR